MSFLLFDCPKIKSNYYSAVNSVLSIQFILKKAWIMMHDNDYCWLSKNLKNCEVPGISIREFELLRLSKNRFYFAVLGRTTFLNSLGYSEVYTLSIWHTSRWPLVRFKLYSYEIKKVWILKFELSHQNLYQKLFRNRNYEAPWL